MYIYIYMYGLCGLCGLSMDPKNEDIPSGVIKHGWKIPELNGAFSGKSPIRGYPVDMFDVFPEMGLSLNSPLE